MNHLDFLSNNNKEDISWGVSNNSKEKMRSTYIANNDEDIKLVDIDK